MLLYVKVDNAHQRPVKNQRGLDRLWQRVTQPVTDSMYSLYVTPRVTVTE